MNKKRQRPSPIRPADAAKGAAAESAFRAWLDASVLPHIYVEQSPISVPVPLRGHIKRPDYIVGIPHVGMVAFDVKAKTLYPEGLVFDLDEIRRLRAFARMFRVTIYFACLDPEGGHQAYWVRLDQLDGIPLQHMAKKPVLILPLSQAQPVDMRASFYDAFWDAVFLG
ncbi:hypothetical protein ABLE93_25490 [Xanthobacter sp. KR7-65]|uniref:hypothetical protein n=1 Tax=Xanthobacter sp. KR7-65 TaxID=3156612 RepID=UPI0032B542B7